MTLSVTKFRGTEVEERLPYVLDGGAFRDDEEHWVNLQFVRERKKRIDWAKELETLPQNKTEETRKSGNGSWLLQQGGIQAEKD